MSEPLTKQERKQARELLIFLAGLATAAIVLAILDFASRFQP